MDEHELVEELNELSGGLVVLSGEEVGLIDALLGRSVALLHNFHQFLLFHLRLYSFYSGCSLQSLLEARRSTHTKVHTQSFVRQGFFYKFHGCWYRYSLLEIAQGNRA